MVLKEKRMNRIFNSSGNTIILPVDHGLTMGPVKGLENLENTIQQLSSQVDAIIMQKGMIKSNYNLLCDRNLGLIMHISGNTCLSPQENRKILTGTVKEAISLGCDGVSIHMNIGNEFDGEMLQNFSDISSECDNYGMPLLAMMYARGDRVDSLSVENIKHVARVAQEMGADIVKVNYSGTLETFKEVVEGCQIPVVMAGGELVSCEDLYKNIKDAMCAGARGVAVGRNVFQSEKPCEMLCKINQIVHK